MIRALDIRCRELLEGEGLADAEIRNRLAHAGFSDWQGAHRCLLRMAAGPEEKQALAVLLPHFLETLTGAPGPDGVLVNLERLSSAVPDRLALFRYLADNPRAVEILVTLFSGSQFLTEILLKNPEHFPWLVERRHLAVPKTSEQLHAEARAAASAGRDLEARLDALRRFQRLELLRIGSSDLLDLFDLTSATVQLSNLADAVVAVCLQIASERSAIATGGFAVIAMGKLGGQELNYSSDIDLLFVAGSDGTPYRKLGERLIEALTSVTAEGFLYRVDMRLRPWGQIGALVPSIDGYLTYMAKHARLWEKQALLKARVIAGDAATGADFLRRVEPLLYGSGSEATRVEVHAMKRRTESLLRSQGRDGREVKLGEGAIRDIEFVAQFLQLVNGAEMPQIRTPNTLRALALLLAHGLLSAEENRVLADGYVFLRTIEHHLQMMYYRQTHVLPEEAEALTQLARRLGFRGENAGEEFRARYQQHVAAIRGVYLRHLGAEATRGSAVETPSVAGAGVQDHLARMDPSYAITFAEEEILRHAAFAEKLGDDRLVEVEAVPVADGQWQVTIVAFDYPGELSLICGLLFAHGFSIQRGDVFTYEPRETPEGEKAEPALRSSGAQGLGQGLSRRRSPPPDGARPSSRRKIVDVFTVRPVLAEVAGDVWARYAAELQDLLRLMNSGSQREAQGKLAKRAAVTMRQAPNVVARLYPVRIEIDNTASEGYTVLRIDSRDTFGFLYELTNALALTGVYIGRMTCDSVGDRVRDVLYVTDARNRKITSSEKQRELRAATVLIKHFTHLLPRSPNPESALLHFGELIAQLCSQPSWPDELASLERPKVLDRVARLLGVSDFLWDDFLRMQYANLFPLVRDGDALASPKGRAQLAAELEAAIAEASARPDAGSAGKTWRAALNTFKDRELFRVDMRHILGRAAEFGQFSEELTDLAEVVVGAACRRCAEELAAQFGEPHLADGRPCSLSVCALGKCGGHELGFASDVELMFVYAGAGATSGPNVITTAELFERLARAVVGTIRAKREGVFEVDLQLRPYGKAGSLAVSLDAFRQYFAPSGPAWGYERQALVKLRPIAGDEALGKEIAALRDELVYSGETFDATAMRAMRERQIRHLVTGGTFNAKYSPGGLADVEYLVQGLQVAHGRGDPRVRSTNTREAMSALAAAGFLRPEDHARLRKAHTFLRWLIDGLRVVRGNARDVTVPAFDSEEFAFLARRLRFGGDVMRLKEELSRHTATVRELSARLLG